MKKLSCAMAMTLALAIAPAAAQQPAPACEPVLAGRVGADERGMRGYVLVVLKTGPTRVPDGPERDEMFRGHFASMKRLSHQGKLVLAGPFDGVDMLLTHGARSVLQAAAAHAATVVNGDQNPRLFGCKAALL